MPKLASLVLAAWRAAACAAARVRVREDDAPELPRLNVTSDAAREHVTPVTAETWLCRHPNPSTDTVSPARAPVRIEVG